MKNIQQQNELQPITPDYTMSVWRNSLIEARKSLHDSAWQDAAIKYRFAFEAAEQLLPLCKDHTKSVKRYIRTAMEFAYTLRMSQFSCDLQALVALVKYNLQKEWLNEPLAHVIGPLEDVSFGPQAEVQHWMQMLFAIDDARKNTVH